MPQMASITINDGKATPVAHVFSPQSAQNGEATFWNRAATIPMGYESLTVVVRAPGKSKTAAHRVTGSISLPSVATVDGQDIVVRESKFDYAFSFSQLSTLQERDDLATLASNLFANALMKTAIENLEPMY